MLYRYCFPYLQFVCVYVSLSFHISLIYVDALLANKDEYRLYIHVLWCISVWCENGGATDSEKFKWYIYPYLHRSRSDKQI